jgi:hypothetical protein
VFAHFPGPFFYFFQSNPVQSSPIQSNSLQLSPIQSNYLGQSGATPRFPFPTAKFQRAGRLGAAQTPHYTYFDGNASTKIQKHLLCGQECKMGRSGRQRLKTRLGEILVKLIRPVQERNEVERIRENPIHFLEWPWT